MKKKFIIIIIIFGFKSYILSTLENELNFCTIKP